MTPEERAARDRAILDKCLAIAARLIEKDRSYGGAALNPLRILSRTTAEENLRSRIDEKLSRIARGNEFVGDKDIPDLTGYLVLLEMEMDRQAGESTAFSEDHLAELGLTLDEAHVEEVIRALCLQATPPPQTHHHH